MPSLLIRYPAKGSTVNSSPGEQAQNSRKQPAGAEPGEEAMRGVSDEEDWCRAGTTCKRMVWAETKEEEANLGVC